MARARRAPARRKPVAKTPAPQFVPGEKMVCPYCGRIGVIGTQRSEIQRDKKGVLIINIIHGTSYDERTKATGIADGCFRNEYIIRGGERLPMPNETVTEEPFA